VLLPILLLILAALSASIVAYGIHPAWAQYHNGIQFILFARRYQLPLFAICIIACLTLIAIVVSGKRAWWLVGLAPILALLAHQFAGNPINRFFVNIQPVFVPADQAFFINDEDWVVGIQDGPDARAYPFSSLYPAPLVVQLDQTDPLAILWSPFANRVIAVRISREIKPHELEVVGMPANTLLIYNSRLGQFINGVTGKTITGQKPSGFGAIIPAMKTTWKLWRMANPQTQVLVPPVENRAAPRMPLLPYYPMPARFANHATPVALIESNAPEMVQDDQILSHPMNFSSENSSESVLLVHDPITGAIRGFNRQVGEDLWPLFSAKIFPQFPMAIMIDSDSGSAWTADGCAIDGKLKGQHLKPIVVDDQVYLEILQFWYPDIAPMKAITPPRIIPPPVPRSGGRGRGGRTGRSGAN
jgi:hypothetical protein